MNTFRDKVLVAIDVCNKELEERKNGLEGESTEEQLETVVLPDLKQLLLRINDNDFPPKEKRFLNSFAYAFKVWGWNMQNPTKLYILLTELNNEYKKI